MAGGLDPHRMTPLQRYLKQVQEQDGNSLRRMSIRAHDKGFEVSAQRISQIINDPAPKRLTADMIRALAAATGTNPLTLAALEDEGLFMPRPAEHPPGQRRRTGTTS